MFEVLEESQNSQAPYSSGYEQSRMTEIVITDGWYRDGKQGRKFEVKIYVNTETGKPYTLVPLFVRNPPEKWVRIR